MRRRSRDHHRCHLRRLTLGPTAAGTSYHARRLALWLLGLIEAISMAEQGARLDELIQERGDSE